MATRLTLIMNDLLVGFLGAGNMARALIRGLLASGAMGSAQVRASDVDDARREALGAELGIRTMADNVALTRWADVVVFAVKPQVIDQVLDQTAPGFTPDTLAVSIAAGVPIATFEERLPTGTRVVRAMPNTPAMAQAGATAIAPGTHATTEDMSHAQTLFDAVGRTVCLGENQLDAVTGLSGSGPAYVMMMIEALADGGVRMGLSRDVALLLAAQTVYGSAKLQLESGEHPACLKDKVTSPGGTTIAGVHSLEQSGLRGALINAVVAATERSRELGAAASKK